MPYLVDRARTLKVDAFAHLGRIRGQRCRSLSRARLLFLSLCLSPLPLARARAPSFLPSLAIAVVRSLFAGLSRALAPFLRVSLHQHAVSFSRASWQMARRVGTESFSELPGSRRPPSLQRRRARASRTKSPSMGALFLMCSRCVSCSVASCILSFIHCVTQYLKPPSMGPLFCLCSRSVFAVVGFPVRVRIEGSGLSSRSVFAEHSSCCVACRQGLGFGL